MSKYNKTQRGWAFYDWANSVYSLVISTAVFPIYFASVTESMESISLFGFHWKPDSLYSYALSISFLIVAIMSPLLSGVADYTGRKKTFMKVFCYLGALSCMGLYFFSEDSVEIAILFSMLASIGFWGSIVFYNAFLPEIAPPAYHDALSARGFAWGYLGGSILLIFNLAMILQPEWFGLSGAGQASRISFVTVGIWWAGFAQITFARLPKETQTNWFEKQTLVRGFQELKKVWRFVKREDKPLRQYLLAFFLYSTGVQTIILLASIFGSAELGLEATDLIVTILIIQFIAIAGSLFFAKLSQKTGNLMALQIQVVIWAAICFAASSLRADMPEVRTYFFVLGGLVGLVLGGVQSLSRSTYSKLLPKTTDTASFFSFYDVTEKLAIVLGTFIFGLASATFGNMRTSAMILSGFFVAGWLVLWLLRRTIRKADAPNLDAFAPD
ncbi:MAG: MFS transporter [Schleiferiaceae bacterium]|nr:MFS transporter [Schleiferiaceae bacterium]